MPASWTRLRFACAWANDRPVRAVRSSSAALLGRCAGATVSVGTPLGLRCSTGNSPAQSDGSVCPVATVPAVVRSSRQLRTCFSAPGTATLSWLGQSAARAGAAVHAAATTASITILLPLPTAPERYEPDRCRSMRECENFPRGRS